MSTRRSSRVSSIAAAAKIAGGADDAGDNPSLSETESSSPQNNVLKGTEVNSKASGTDETTAAKTTKKTKKKASPKTKKNTSPTKKEKAAEPDESHDETVGSSAEKHTSTKKKATQKKMTPKKRKSKTATASDDETLATKKQKSSPRKKAKAADHQRWTERTPIARHWDPEVATEAGGSYAFTVVSWNVAGLRAFVKKQPDALTSLANKYQADVICLQEHKLQEGHLDDKKFKLREYFEEKLGDFDAHWSYSSKKKGYSGTVMFIRKRGGAEHRADDKKGDATKKGKKQATLGAFFKSGGEVKKGGNFPTREVPISHLSPINVDTELGLPAHDGEGRTVIAEFPLFFLANVYVPNSGQKLERLGYRTEEWDRDFVAKMQHLEKTERKPVIWLGDLNVAYDGKDTWNEGAKHLAKSAGTTPEERASFERQLGGDYVDAFRRLHPEARGHYSYWSQRAGNREPNRGLRLDYFICSKELMEDGDGKRACVRDSYVVPEHLGSDHCPIILEIEIKK